MLGWYLYAGYTASYLDDQTRHKLRELRRDGATLDRMQTVRFAFTAPTRDIADRLQARLRALEFTVTVMSDAEIVAADAAAAAAAAAEPPDDADDDDGDSEAAAAESPAPSKGALTAPSSLFDVEAERPMVPTRSSLRRHERQLDVLARALGARYDGWRLPGLY